MGFRVGDVVQITSCYTLETRFGLDSDGDVKLPDGYMFRHSEDKCGTVATVQTIDDNGNIVLDNELTIRKDNITAVLNPVTDSEKQHVVITQYNDATMINNTIERGYKIREFHKEICILERSKPLILTPKKEE